MQPLNRGEYVPQWATLPLADCETYGVGVAGDACLENAGYYGLNGVKSPFHDTCSPFHYKAWQDAQFRDVGFCDSNVRPRHPEAQHVH